MLHHYRLIRTRRCTPPGSDLLCLYLSCILGSDIKRNGSYARVPRALHAGPLRMIIKEGIEQSVPAPKGANVRPESALPHTEQYADLQSPESWAVRIGAHLCAR